VVVVASAFYKFKRQTKHVFKGISIVSDHRQTTTSFRAIQRERPDDYMSAWANCFSNACTICGAVAWLGQKVERGSVMPNIVRFGWLPSGNVGNDPSDTISVFAQSVP